MAYLRALLILGSFLSFSCAEILGISDLREGGQDDGGPGPGNDGGIGPGKDGGGPDPGGDGGIGPGTDGGAPQVCGNTQCSNCLDDDGDGAIDGKDVHCTSAADDDEYTFITAIPGDNIDADPSDCFYDGNSGSGDDGCQMPQCCLLSDDNCGGTVDCSLPQRCIDFCAPAAPVGCDCFGCCTVCQNGNCQDVLIFPDATPGWDCHDLDNLGDPIACPQCFKAPACSSACGPNTDCVLCPGQGPGELPPECNRQNQCPDGRQVCSETVACPASEYCANGCCVHSLAD